MNHLSVRVFAVALLMGSLECQAFQRAPLPAHQRRVSFREAATARTFGDEEKNQEKKHFLLEEFSTHAGEVINPYKILKVSREADRSEIRKAYIKLSKRYHPDGARHRDILPGKW